MRAGHAMAGLALLLAACGQAGEENAANSGAATSSAPRAADDRKLSAILGADPRFTALVRSAGMAPVLEGREPYTVLAPTPEALAALPPGSLERLQQMEGRPALTALLRHHILPGTVLVADLSRAVDAGNGQATLATMAGEPLVVTREGNRLVVRDARGTSARIVGDEQRASNGVVHRIDRVLAPPIATGPGSD